MSTDLRQLSERELQILQLVASGLSNQQIANELGVTVNTVKVHLRNVFGKIGAASRTEATLYAVRVGIITIDATAQSQVEASDQEQVVPPEQPESPPNPAESEPVVVSGVDAEPAILELLLHPTESTPELGQPFTNGALQTIAVAQVGAAPSTPQRWQRFGFALLIMLVVVLAAVGVWAWSRSRASVNVVNDATTRTRWQGAPALPAPRAAFGVASLGDQVYIVAGENQSGVLNSLERYDVRFGAWTSLSSKPTAVTDAQAAVLGGKIYVPGGRRSADPQDVSASFERYDPLTESWETLPDLPEPRSAYALAASEGRLYVFGGWDGTTFRNEVFAFDPEQERWSTRASLPTPRGFAKAVAVEGNVYIIGGENADGALANNEVYTPARDTSDGQPWVRRAPMPQPRSRFGAAAALSGIYVVGGQAELPSVAYDIRTDSWQTFEAAPRAPGNQLGVVFVDPLLLALGGNVPDEGYTTRMQAYQALYRVSLPAPQVAP